MIPALASILLTMDYNFYFNKTTENLNGNLIGKINELGQGGYNAARSISLMVCCISLVLIFICRFIFRIASPKEDAHAKQYIQRTLVVIALLSFITTIFSVIMGIAEGL